jgi:hypothetical protein
MGAGDLTVLIHELTHAAQDQRYGLWFGSPRVGASLGWLDIVSIWAPYVLGPGLVGAIVERDGVEGLDAAYEAPPRSLSDVIWTSRYRPRVAREATTAGTGTALDVLGWAVLLDPFGTPQEVWDLLEDLVHEGYFPDDRDEECVAIALGFRSGTDLTPLDRWIAARGGSVDKTTTDDIETVTVGSVCQDAGADRGPDADLLDRVALTALTVQAIDVHRPGCRASLAAQALAELHGDEIVDDTIGQAAANALQNC